MRKLRGKCWELRKDAGNVIGRNYAGKRGGNTSRIIPPPCEVGTTDGEGSSPRGAVAWWDHRASTRIVSWKFRGWRLIAAQARTAPPPGGESVEGNWEGHPWGHVFGGSGSLEGL